MDRCLQYIRLVRQVLTIFVALLINLFWVNQGNTSNIGLGPVKAQVSKCRDVQAQVSKTETKNRELAHRIAQLKKGRKNDVANRNLQSLLRQSVQAANELERLTQQRAVAINGCEDSLRKALRKIDALIGDEKALLRSTSKTIRIRAAKNIRQLLNQRKELRTLEKEFRTSSSAPKQWKQYQVKIDPLDGPQELREKAEFLEDTRDKLKRKRTKVLELLKEKRQLLALAKAANQFATEVGTFDETIRSGRVERSANNRLSNSPSLGASSFSADEATAGSPRGAPSNSAQPQSSGPTTEGASSTDLASEPGDLSSGNQATNQRSSNPISQSIQSPQQSASTLLNQISPEALVNLDVLKLSSGSFEFKDLEKIMSSLEKLDRYLKSQSSSIRTRAQKIEDDEKRALQK